MGGGLHFQPMVGGSERGETPLSGGLPPLEKPQMQRAVYTIGMHTKKEWVICITLSKGTWVNPYEG